MIVVDRRGRLLADSGRRRRARHAATPTGPEIAAALGGTRRPGAPATATRSATDILATAVPILERGRPVGAVRITQSVAAVNDAVRTLDPRPRRCSACVVLALGLVAGALIARQIARPIRRLDDAARRVASGDLDARARSRAAPSSGRWRAPSTR